MAENEEEEELQHMPLPNRRWNDVSDASYKANEIITIVNGSMLMTPKAFESHASLINLESVFSSPTLVKPNKKKRGGEEEMLRRREDKDRRLESKLTKSCDRVCLLFTDAGEAEQEEERRRRRDAEKERRQRP
ncbi:hypothetical protein DY000_02057405 [Brassica cretica]|uniref:Uncharacterized protein n=1 Tax=Brassica cretica TaxID=69181 RepID=A0ABQ7AIW5_BRACR|nr:hypothetical protein DY000_02057405 [Brassica cretica]